MPRPDVSSTTMPCCCPAIDTAATSSSPPHLSIAASSASHHAPGSTCVPSGCAAHPERTSVPRARSRMTTLQLCVEESIPATRVIASPAVRDPVQRAGSARTKKVLERQLVEMHKAEALATEVGIRVEVLIGAAVGEKVLIALARGEGAHVDLPDARCGECFLSLRVGAECRGAFLEQQVGAHIGGSRVTDASDVFGAAGLEVEVAWSVVSRATVRTAVLEQVDQRERIGEVAVAEDKILVVLDATLAVEIDAEELAVIERLRDAGCVVQARHLLVSNLRIHADELGAFQRLDKGKRMADRRKQNVAARFVGLGLNSEANVVAPVGDIVPQQVHSLPVAFQRSPDVLGRVILRTFSAAPHDERLRAELGGEVEVAQYFAQGEATHRTVIGRETAILEHRRAEQVGGDHRHDHSRVGQNLLEPFDLFLALGVGRTEGEEVVVMEGEAVGAELTELRHSFHDVQWGSCRSAERVGSVVANGPQTEGELVVARGHCSHGVSFSLDVICCLNKLIRRWWSCTSQTKL